MSVSLVTKYKNNLPKDVHTNILLLYLSIQKYNRQRYPFDGNIIDDTNELIETPITKESIIKEPITKEQVSNNNVLEGSGNVKSKKDEYHDLKIKKLLFPFISDVQKLKQLKIDPDSYRYISTRKDSQHITNLIIKYCGKNITITDGTSGVGGNVISFGLNFKKVNAVEIVPLRAEYLKNNVAVYGLKNVTVYNDDYTKIYENIVQNVVFLDPPWEQVKKPSPASPMLGGIRSPASPMLAGIRSPEIDSTTSELSSVTTDSNHISTNQSSDTSFESYKAKSNIRLSLGNMSIEDLCVNILNKIKETKFVIFKLPMNYDLVYFNDNVKNIAKIHKEILKKMFIIIVERK